MILYQAGLLLLNFRTNELILQSFESQTVIFSGFQNFRLLQEFIFIGVTARR